MKKIETLAEYQQLASRTCPDLGTPGENALHMQLGIITEIGETLDIFKKKHAYKKEIDLVNLGEELADQLWYVSNNALQRNVNVFDALTLEAITTIVEDNFIIPSTEARKIHTTIGILLGLNASTLNMEKFDYVNYVASVYAICKIWKLDLLQILTNNINKLKVRYPDKFDEEKAANRDLKAERKELEK